MNMLTVKKEFKITIEIDDGSTACMIRDAVEEYRIKYTDSSKYNDVWTKCDEAAWEALRDVLG